jgi:hypothetical protein
MAAPGLRAAEPSVLTGAMVGYRRVSIHGRILDWQLLTLAKVRCLPERNTRCPGSGRKLRGSVELPSRPAWPYILTVERCLAATRS